MPTTIPVGARVDTKLGPAIVLGTENGQARIRLEEHGIEVTISTADLRVIKTASSVRRGLETVNRRPGWKREEPADPRQIGLRTIEALRFGLVPAAAIERLTIGFAALKAWASSRLPHGHDGEPLVSEILGPFGTGKSHTMAAIRHIAREKGYLTAHAEVDGRFISLSDPARLLFALCSNLAGRDLDSTTPILDVYLKAVERQGKAPRLFANIDRIGDNYRTVQYLVENDLLDEHGHLMDAILSSSNEVTANEANRAIYPHKDLSAVWNGTLVRSLIGKRVADRPKDFIAALVGHTLVAEQAGYSGLVITIDEFEVEYGLPPDRFQRIQSLLGALSDYLAGDTELPDAPIAFFIASVRSNMKVGYPELDELLSRANADSYELEPLSTPHLRELGEKIHGLYTEVYGLDAKFDARFVERTLAALEVSDLDDSGRTRAFVKRYVAALDSHYGPGPNHTGA